MFPLGSVYKMQPPILDNRYLATRQVLIFLVVLTACAALVLLTRLPYEVHQLYNYDDVNFAYSIGDFDVARSQPQAPGYPLFVVQLRILHWFALKRPESILLWSRMLGSIAAVTGLVYAGRLILGWAPGLWAALLLALHPAFWYTGLTSAVRLQLAVFSIAVAALCYPCWRGDARRVLPATLALGLGAGVRPELGVILFPLWLVAVFRAEPTWPRRWRAAAVLAGTVLLWLVPTMLDAGGLQKFVKLNWTYFSTQAGGMTSPLFGAGRQSWEEALVWLIVWTLCTLPALLIPATLTLRNQRAALAPVQLAFLAAWFLPGFLFSALIHVGDPGHVLALVPVICLFGGFFISRSVEQMALTPARVFAGSILVLGGAGVYYSNGQRPEYALPAMCIVWTVAALIALLPKIELPRWAVRTQAAILVLIPSVYLSQLIFFSPSWYHGATPGSGLAAQADLIWQHVDSGLRATSLGQIRSVVDGDDHRFRELRYLRAERPGQTVVVWNRGFSEWRKVAYYFPEVPVYVLQPDGVVRVWRGPRDDTQFQRGETVRIPAASRVIWMVNARLPEFAELNQQFPVNPPRLLYYSDLSETGSAHIGPFQFTW